MRIRYHELVGKRVVTADGAAVGRVVDLDAKSCGERLVVQALLVGSAAFLTRIGLKGPGIFQSASPTVVPWSAVLQIGKKIEVRADWETLT